MDDESRLKQSAKSAITEIVGEGEIERVFEVVMEARRRASVNYITARMALIDMQDEGKLAIDDNGVITLVPTGQ